MDQVGAFIAQMRKERGLTQKELADRLNVTDKAVSKWETGRGFPDVKLLEPLAQALEVSLVELIQGRRQESDRLTVAEAEAVVSQAMDQSQRVTARRYLSWFRWTLSAIAAVSFLHLFPRLIHQIETLYFELVIRDQLAMIGGADGPTAIFTTHQLTWLDMVIPAALFVFSVLVAVRVRKLERELR